MNFFLSYRYNLHVSRLSGFTVKSVILWTWHTTVNIQTLRIGIVCDKEILKESIE